MTIFGVALLAFCTLVGVFVGDLLGIVLGVKANVGGVGLAMMLLFWGLWFADDRFGRDTRARLMAVLAVSAVAIFVGRALALLLPFRLRPMHADRKSVV